MLMISIPKADVPALKDAGVQCKVNGESVTMRFKDGYLLYRGEGQDNRCKVLHQEPLPNGLVSFMAASHGDENEPHSIFGLGADGKPVDFLNPDRPLPGLPGGPPLN
jgi:hypothetical protein